MAGIPDKSIDIIITDPPFGLNHSKFDDPDIFFKVEAECYRVLKSNAWFIFWWSNKKIPEIARLKLFTYQWQIMVKFHSTYSKSKIGDRAFTPIFVYSKGNPKMVYRRADVLSADELPLIQTKIRSGEFKSTATLAQLLLMFSQEKDIILDPFVGFGSLPMTCKLFKRRFIGIDIDKQRIKIAEKLIRTMRLTKSIPEMLQD